MNSALVADTRAVVIGASGLVGSYLMDAERNAGSADAALTRGTFHAFAAFPDLVPLDVTDAGATEAFLNEAQPGLVYLPAANPNVEWVEADPEAARRVNVDPVARIARWCKANTARLVYYSSDYVFDGEAGPYAENDTPRPISEYGRQKLETERLLTDTLTDAALILRVTVVFGWEARAKNFAHRLVNQLRDRENHAPIRVPNDQIGSPSYAPSIANASVALARGGASGVYHLAGSTLADRYEFALAIARVFDLPSDRLQPVSTQTLSQLAPRPLKAGMIISKAQAFLGEQAPLSGYLDALRQMKESESVFHASQRP